MNYEYRYSQEYASEEYLGISKNSVRFLDMPGEF